MTIDLGSCDLIHINDLINNHILSREVFATPLKTQQSFSVPIGSDYD